MSTNSQDNKDGSDEKSALKEELNKKVPMSVWRVARAIAEATNTGLTFYPVKTHINKIQKLCINKEKPACFYNTT